MIIDDMIAFWARIKPHQPAVIQPDMIVTYRGLADAIEFIARRIATIGFEPQKPGGHRHRASGKADGGVLRTPAVRPGRGAGLCRR